MCVENAGNEASLDLGRVYRVVRPKANDPEHYLRVIDNEGEDYLYFSKQFVAVEVPAKGRRLVTELAYATL
jgi:hypothetical protein